jgi:hypothetical protein
MRPSKSIRKHLRAARATFKQSRSSLLLRATCMAERCRKLQMRGRQSEPFATNIVDVREDGSDGSPFAPRQLRAPRSRIEMLENDLVHSLIYGVALHQHLAKVSVNVSLRTSLREIHEITL